MVHNAEKNGFHRVIRRVGTRVLLDVDEWNLWVDAQNGILQEGAQNDV